MVKEVNRFEKRRESDSRLLRMFKIVERELSEAGIGVTLIGPDYNFGFFSVGAPSGPEIYLRFSVWGPVVEVNDSSFYGVARRMAEGYEAEFDGEVTLNKNYGE